MSSSKYCSIISVCRRWLVASGSFPSSISSTMLPLPKASATPPSPGTLPIMSAVSLKLGSSPENDWTSGGGSSPRPTVVEYVFPSEISNVGPSVVSTSTRPVSSST
ncbi:hypothetical protein BRC69_06695 [Halobacteriales archaeon QH_6_66_25]|nr:MAG: hypothetical protein BRC69_06695 [Halobacteriales archaeon QH_6_66_25]